MLSLARGKIILDSETEHDTVCNYRLMKTFSLSFLCVFMLQGKSCFHVEMEISRS